MPTETFSVIAEFQEFAAEQVKSGRFTDARAVFEALKAALERENADDDLDVEYVRQAVEEGMASGVAEGDVIGRLRQKYNLPARS